MRIIGERRAEERRAEERRGEERREGERRGEERRRADNQSCLIRSHWSPYVRRALCESCSLCMYWDTLSGPEEGEEKGGAGRGGE
jgi:hypothetical protein